MKQPRASDFDPTGKEHELKSPMEDFPAILVPQLSQSSPHMQEPVRPVPPVRDVLAMPANRRKIKSRHPFDIYEDQVETLKQLSVEDRMRGGTGSMSAMVREALDEFIAKKRT